MLLVIYPANEML